MIPAPDPLPTAHRLAQGAVESLRCAVVAEDPAVRVLHIRRALRLVRDVQKLLLGMP